MTRVCETILPSATDRVRMLRQHALDKTNPTWRTREADLLWWRGWMEGCRSAHPLARRAHAKAYMLSHATPVIDEGELLVGKACPRPLTDAEQREVEASAEARKAVPMAGGQGSHMAVDYRKLLDLGIEGVQAEIVERRRALDLTDPETLEKDLFYQACLEVLDGVLAYSDRYAACAASLAAACADPARRAELEEIARICARVPRRPAETFREALQSMHFLSFCMEGLYQLGRPDRILIGRYRRDVAEGRLTPDQALELIDCLGILYNEYIPRGLAVGYMVGGRDAAGRDVSNELTRLFIESIGHTRMIYPGVGLCWTEDTPEELMRLSCRLLAEGLSHPALFNDRVITRGLLECGLPPEEACEYIHSTCVEITPCSGSAVWVASPYHNLIQILLDVLDSSDPKSFDELKALYRERLGRCVRAAAIEQNRLQMERSHVGGDPLVSCFVNDCLARGRDIDQGGARYNWIMPSFVGLANLADSLVSIKRLVFEQRKLDLAGLNAALKSNFEGCEALRLEILNTIPKYGNDCDEVDALAVEIAGWVREEVAKYTTFRGDRFVPSFFCWVMHERLGAQTGASPDGRTKGFPLGDGSGPAQGRERRGPTASILSSTKWEHHPFIGGIAVNMKFARSLLRPESLDAMMALVRTFMARGGFELQVNVVDRDTLLKARARPELFQDLVVRVGGYSDYFVHLSPQMQEEVILRTEHAI